MSERRAGLPELVSAVATLTETVETLAEKVEHLDECLHKVREVAEAHAETDNCEHQQLHEQLAMYHRAQDAHGAKLAEGTERFNVLHERIGEVSTSLNTQIASLTSAVETLRRDIGGPLAQIALRMQSGQRDD